MPRTTPRFPFMLDYKPRFFLSWFLYRLFKRVKFNEAMREELKRMNREGTVVYAIKYRGALDYLLYHFLFLKSRLPAPKLALDLNMALFLPLSDVFRILKFHLGDLLKHGRLRDKGPFFETAVQEGITSLICLVDPKGFRKHYIHARKDALHLLLEAQQHMDKPIFLVPLLVLYKNTPEKEVPNLREIFFGFKDKPGTLRKIMLFFRHNRRAFIDFGTPINLKNALIDPVDSLQMERTTETVKQQAIESIDRQKRVILGPVMKSRQQLRETVLKDATVSKTITGTASGNKGRLKHRKKEAARYFNEIAADYNIAYIEFANRVLTWIWKRMFEGIDVLEEELAAVRARAGKGPLIYIPSHKSHIDYLILNYVLYRHHMHVPRIAAGKNLNFWPIGHFFRKSGAFFIRRSFKGARLYAVIFKRYIKALLQEGHPLEFFIEGGRSRSGKLILPKIGFLSILVEAYMEGYCDDLTFVPAAIVYDRIIEEKTYLKELGGIRKPMKAFIK
ncbi:MAG: 1-acyl-sn-glycerol-3-phosphate acyltransferase [Deltaproteobacteria bacterium]|nr:1-acyl-sn-glycerol-3-phosphate acyltransferase [Deltaproteobacteria bacterium]